MKKVKKRQGYIKYSQGLWGIFVCLFVLCDTRRLQRSLGYLTFAIETHAASIGSGRHILLLLLLLSLLLSSSLTVFPPLFKGGQRSKSLAASELKGKMEENTLYLAVSVQKVQVYSDRC